MNRAYGKIFMYEWKRMAVNWFFLTMLFINGAYAWYVLTTDILMGTAYTAPFSVWSYCAYIGKTLPIVMAAVILLLAGYYGKKQKQADILLAAAPVTAEKQLFVRTAVLGVCFAIICAADALVAVVFYVRFFGYWNFAEFFIPSLLIMIPCFLISAALGHFAGRLHVGVVYLMAAGVVFAGYVLPANIFDFYGAGYFSAYPLTLEAGKGGEPQFVMETAWIVVRLLYSFLGAGMFFLHVCSMRRKPTKA